MSDDRYDLDSAVNELEPRPKRSAGRTVEEVQTKRKKGSTFGSSLLAWAQDNGPKNLLILVIVWLLLLLHSAWSEQGDYRATVDSASGITLVHLPDTYAPKAIDTWTSLWPDRVLLTGDQVSCGQGALTIRFQEGSSIAFQPGTQVDLAQLGFDRASGGRIRRLILQRGGIAVRTGLGIGQNSLFAVQVSGKIVSGYVAAYQLTNSQLVVTAGQVDVAASSGSVSVPVTAGQSLSFLAGQPATAPAATLSAAQQAVAKLPAFGVGDQIKVRILNFEEGVVLKTTGFLLGAVGHQPGSGNPFAGFSLVNSARRGQAQKRMGDLHVALTNLSAPPPSLRLDDWRALGVSGDNANFLRQAFFRGQLMRYTVTADGKFELLALATDRDHTKVFCNHDGVRVERAK